MALIKCPECGKEISEHAKSCIHCGYKIDQKNIIIKKDKPKKEFSKKNNKIIYIIILLALIICVVLTFILLPKKSSYLGKWEHYITWKESGKIVRTSYAKLHFFENKTFEYLGYDIGSEEKEYFSGTYNEVDGTIYINFKSDNDDHTIKLVIDDKKLCENEKGCDNYFVKNATKDEATIIINEDISHITHDEYLKILSDKEDAIVIFVADWSQYATKYMKILPDFVKGYKTKFYYYDYDSDNSKIKINGVPETFIIKNGEVKDKIEGYQEEITVLNLGNKMAELNLE